LPWIDRAGALRVGPKSAGADPGPACYARGGIEPTVTDCNLLLGYLDKESLLGGDLPIDHAAAKAAIDSRLARPLGVDIRTAAAAVIDIVNHAMAEALKIVSVQRGHDPRYEWAESSTWAATSVVHYIVGPRGKVGFSLVHS
jgi:N-methylhydantoinase A